MPPGISRRSSSIYSASTVPVLQLGLTSDTLSEQQIFDSGNNFIRTQLATVQGAALPFPYGGKQRLISVDLDPVALQAKRPVAGRHRERGRRAEPDRCRRARRSSARSSTRSR